ncbi:MAG: ABC transporter permease subunit [Bacteroidota bacterium]
MIWKVVLNEWRLLYRSKILQALTLGFALIVLLCMLLALQQHQKQTELYTSAKDELRAQWESIDSMNPHSAAHYGTYVFKPTNILSNFDEGIISATGNVLRVEGHVQNEMVHSEASQMTSVSRFGKFKISLVLQYILPLLLIFLAFNALNSERQKGRLKLLVLQGSSPRQLILSKVLAVWSYSLALLGIVLLLYIGLYFDNLDADTLLRLGMFALSYMLYYFIIIGLSVLFVAHFKSAMLALTTNLSCTITTPLL